MRRYTLKQRAASQEATRRRIIEAAVRLHGTRGLAATTVTQIAAEAGVGRQTVYRHFRDELALTRACSGLYFERNPLPAHGTWTEIEDAPERTRVGLTESYAYHRQTEPMISQILPEAADSPIMLPYHQHWKDAAEVLASIWDVPRKKKKLLRASLGHAIVFPTWHSLVRDHELTDAEAVELMLGSAQACVTG